MGGEGRKGVGEKGGRGERRERRKEERGGGGSDRKNMNYNISNVCVLKLYRSFALVSRGKEPGHG